MSTLWFEKKPGGPMAGELDGGYAVVIGEPDWVRLPPELGGAQERVLAIKRAECPKCRERIAKHYALETVFVAECNDCGFIFYLPTEA